MSTTPVTLDMSTAQPISQPVQLDMSTATPIGASSATAPPSGSVGEQNFVNPIAQGGADLLAGFGKGIADTVHGTGELIRKGGNLIHAGAGDAIVPPTGQAALASAAAPVNTDQKIGKGAEDVAEFVAGDEALKTVSLGKRALEAAGLAEKYEKASPFVRAAIEHTMNAIRQGTVAGGETTAKTGDIKEGAAAGAATAATSGALSLAGEGLGAGYKAIKGALGAPELPVLAKPPVLPAAPAAPGVTPSLENVPSAKTVAAVQAKVIQPNLQNGIKQVLSDSAEELGVPKPTGTSFRDSAKELGDSVFSRSKSTFSKIDEVTNGEFTNVDNKIKNLNKEMRLKAGVNDATDQLMGQQKQILEGKMQDLLESAKQKGVDPAIVDSARADYRKAQALYDLDGQIKKATLATADPTKQLTNIKGLYTRLNTLSDSGRLEEAVGPEKAKAILSHAEDSHSALEQVKQSVKDVTKQAKTQVADHEASVKAAQADHEAEIKQLLKEHETWNSAAERDFQRRLSDVKNNRKWAAIVGGSALAGSAGGTAVNAVTRAAKAK